MKSILKAIIKRYYFLFTLIFLFGCNNKNNSEHSFVPFLKKNNKYVYVRAYSMEPINMKEYDFLHFFSENIGRVFNYEKKLFGYVDTNGVEIIPLRYHNAGDFNEGLAWVQIDSKFGYIDKNGNQAIPFAYDNARDFSENLACVENNGKWGFIDKNGLAVIPIKYDACESFSENAAAVKIGNKWGFINKSGKFIIEARYDFATNFKDGMSNVSENNNQKYINIKNEIVYPKKIGPDIFKENEKYGLKSADGSIIASTKYDNILNFNDGVATIISNNLIGAIDQNGHEIIPPKYAIQRDFMFFHFNKGFSFVSQDQMRYDYSNGKKYEYLQNQFFYVDKKGREYKEEYIENSNLLFLKGFKGKYPLSDLKILENSKIKPRLSELLKNEYEFVLDFWQAETPIKIIDDNFIYTDGFMAHNCCDPYFILMADISSDILFFGLKKNGEMKIYAENNQSIPPMVKDIILNNNAP